MNNILVTGSAGFIGSNFVRYLLNADSSLSVFSLDALTYAGSLENLRELPDPARHTFIQGDICDRELVERLLHDHRIDTIVHFAAESHVDRSIHGPAPFVRTNILGTFNLLEAARQFWQVEQGLGNHPVRFHHISTDEVYGSLQPGEPAWTEASPYAPNSPYAASKASSDHLVRSYGHTYALPFTLTNCSNNYGPYQFPEKLIPLVILNALQGKPLPVYGDGQQVRDWLYVEDHCEAVWLVLAGGRVGETYNLGGGNQPANLTIVETICDLLDRLVPDSPHRPHRSLITFVPDRPGHDRRYAMDSARIAADLGWKPRHTLQQGLEQTVRWFLDHRQWVDSIQDQPGYQGWIETNYSNRGEIP
jgi:dTDP-glucose 4,6-dehydratase